MKDRDDSIYRQFLDIHRAQEYYYNSVLDAYQKLCTKDGENLPWSPEFNTLVVKCACLSNNKKFVSKNIKLYDARDPVEFLTVVITYAYKRKIPESLVVIQTIADHEKIVDDESVVFGVNR